MSAKRIVLGCALAAFPLLACSGSPSEEQSQGAEAYTIGPGPGTGAINNVCTPFSQPNLEWTTSNGTIDDSYTWYPTPIEDPYLQWDGSQWWVAYVGVSTRAGAPVEIAWVPWNDTAMSLFSQYNGVCEPGTLILSSFPKYELNTPGQIGTSPPVECCRPLNPTQSATSVTPECATPNLISSLTAANRLCSMYVSTSPAECYSSTGIGR